MNETVVCLKLLVRSGAGSDVADHAYREQHDAGVEEHSLYLLGTCVHDATDKHENEADDHYYEKDHLRGHSATSGR